MGGKRITPSHRNKDFSKEEIEILSRNPNVKSVTAKQINYTDEFKMRFLEQYQTGKMPLDIFIEAGFDQKLIGQGRIDKAAGRWKRKALRPGGVYDQKKGHSGKKLSGNKELSLDEEIQFLKQQNAYLRQENSFLRENTTFREAGDAQEKIKSVMKYQIIHNTLTKSNCKLTVSQLSYTFKNRYKGARGIKMVLFRQYGIQMNLKKIRRLMKKYQILIEKSGKP